MTGASPSVPAADGRGAGAALESEATTTSVLEGTALSRIQAAAASVAVNRPATHRLCKETLHLRIASLHGQHDLIAHQPARRVRQRPVFAAFKNQAGVTGVGVQPAHHFRRLFRRRQLFVEGGDTGIGASRLDDPWLIAYAHFESLHAIAQCRHVGLQRHEVRRDETGGKDRQRDTTDGSPAHGMHGALQPPSDAFQRGIHDALTRKRIGRTAFCRSRSCCNR